MKKKILKYFVNKLVNEAFIKEIALILLRKLVKSSKNQLDDKLLQSVEKALG